MADHRPNTRNGPRNPAPANPPPMTYEDVVGLVGRLAGVVEQRMQEEDARPVNPIRREDVAVVEGKILKRFQDMGPPTFRGTPDPNIADAWIMQMEKIFEIMACETDERVRFATFKLEGEAEHWWRATKVCLRRDDAVITWDRFLVAFQKRYIPDSAKEQKALEFNRLVQSGRSVAEYEAKFAELSRYAPYLVDEETRKASKFVRGLDFYIRDKLVACKFESYSLAVDRAMTVEMNCTESRREQKMDHKRAILAGDHDKDEHQDNRDNKRVVRESNGNRSCYRCGGIHPGKECHQKTGACYNCGEIGHLIRDCPKLKRNFGGGTKTTTGKPGLGSGK